MNQLATAPESQPQTPGYVFHGDAGNDQAPTLRGFLTVLKRRRMLALQTFTLIVALGIVVTLMTKPIYRSTSRILVEGKSSVMTLSTNTSPLSSLLLPSAGQTAETQVEILRSSTIANKAFKDSRITYGTVRLDVRRVADTDVIELSGTSVSARSAFEYVNAVPRIYLRDIRASRMREVSAALEFAEKRLKEENIRLKANELALQKFRQGANLVDPAAQREGEMNVANASRTALGEAEAQVDSLRAQLDAFVATRRAAPAQIVSPTTTTNTVELQSLRQKIAELRSQRQQALYLYKENDDEIRKFDNQISELQQHLSRTPSDVTSVSRSSNPAIAQLDARISETSASLRAAEADVSLLRKRTAALTSGLNRYNPIERQQGQLQRDIASSAAIAASLGQSAQDLSLRKKALEAANDPISVIESASDATRISPNIFRNLTLAVLLGVMLACGAAMLQESLDDHMRDENEVRAMLGVPILGHFPTLAEGRSTLPDILRAAQVRAQERSGGALSEIAGLPNSTNGIPLIEMELGKGQEARGYAEGHDRSLLEKYRVLRSNVQFTLVNRTHSTLLVTSSVPQEGKSTTASSLAAAMALDGRRVILIDADLHRPRLHQIFELPVQPGLTNVLVGQAQLADCLLETGVAGLRLLPAGILPPNPVELLNSPMMDTILESLKIEADVLIFDSPPLLATADAQVLASRLDGVLYVMHLGKVPKAAIARSFEMLEQARANILGIVLNKIDMEDTTSGYYGGYYGKDNEGGEHGDDPAHVDVESDVLKGR